jgi:hypothetical protein
MSYNGQLVQVSGQPQVYLVVNGQACWVPNWNTYLQLFGDNPGLIQRTTQQQFSTIPMGSPLANLAFVATVSGGTTTYLVSGQANPFAAGIFSSYPFPSGNTVTVPQPVINYLGQGPTITS